MDKNIFRTNRGAINWPTAILLIVLILVGGCVTMMGMLSKTNADIATEMIQAESKKINNGE